MNIRSEDLLKKMSTKNISVGIGFIVFVVLGVWFSSYMTRFVPGAINGLSEAAVYLGSQLTTSPAPVASSTAPVVPIQNTEASSSTSTTDRHTSVPSAPSVPQPGNETSGAFPIGSSTSASLSWHGLPDLTVSITAVGYLTSASADSFVASSTVPAKMRPAVKFTIRNIGTNVSGPWCFSASIPTQTAHLYQSKAQQSLNPGDYIDYTLGFDQANTGANQKVSITANAITPNCPHAITESHTDNDSTSTTLVILGS